MDRKRRVLGDPMDLDFAVGLVVSFVGGAEDGARRRWTPWIGSPSLPDRA